MLSPLINLPGTDLGSLENGWAHMLHLAAAGGNLAVF